MNPAALPPNILFFFTDQQRADTTGINGCPLDLTPNLDRMALEGVHAPLTFTPQPVCGPARSCLQSGQFASRTGCHTNDKPLPQGIPTLAGSFHEAGYDTAYIGKWHLGDSETKGPVRPEQRGGYRHWLAANALEHTSDAYETNLYDEEGREVRLPGYRVDALTDAAIRHITRPEAKQQPWFLFLSFLEPHHQNHRDDYPAPTGYEQRYAGRWTPPDLAALPAWDGSGITGGTAQRHLPGYYGMIKRLDEALGRVEDALRSTGQLENTIIVFTSDHGCHFRTRNREYKRSVHDASIRVPLVINGPGFRGRGRIDRLVSLLDLPPTLLEAAGAEIPESFDGGSLMPLLADPGAEWPMEVFVQTSESETGRAVRTRRWKYGVVATSGEPWQRHAEEYRETYLYDLQADPWELKNLVCCSSHRPLAEALRGRLLAWMKRAGEPVATILPPEEIHPSGQLIVTEEELAEVRKSGNEVVGAMMHAGKSKQTCMLR
jgi:arylsulfatase A-like enzyme